MSDLNDAFEAAAVRAKQLPSKPDNDTLLKLYAFYKQGSSGDVSGDKPGFFDFVGVAKYDAWEQLKGSNQDEARQNYIDLIDSLEG